MLSTWVCWAHSRHGFIGRAVKLDLFATLSNLIYRPPCRLGFIYWLDFLDFEHYRFSESIACFVSRLFAEKDDDWLAGGCFPGLESWSEGFLVNKYLLWLSRALVSYRPF